MSSWLAPSNIAKVVLDVFVGDIDEAIATYAEVHRLSSWRTSDLTVEQAEFRGAPVELRLRAAMLDLGAVNIELLQATGSPEVVSWFVGNGDGASWHPVAYYESHQEAAAATDVLISSGVPCLFTGRIAGSQYWVFETGALPGGRFEIAGGDLSDIQSTPATH
jgi:hypothetical protein